MQSNFTKYNKNVTKYVLKTKAIMLFLIEIK